MLKALLMTIGTEITCGEIVNSNAAWISRQLEEQGVRVFSHLSVRDQFDEIARALSWSEAYDLVIVTGGLGPTSDDITREAMARFTSQPLEFDDSVWQDLQKLHLEKQLPVREAHRHQCWFPKDSVRLINPVGSALGFFQTHQGRSYFVLPGPPRELEAMWAAEVTPRLERLLQPTTNGWVRWICLGVPESEVAELVESVISGRDIEVGYRAQVPYVKVKVYLDSKKQADVVSQIEQKLAPYLVGNGSEDLSEEFLKLWPQSDVWISDQVTSSVLIERLLGAWRALEAKQVKVAQPAFARTIKVDEGLIVTSEGNELVTQVNLGELRSIERKVLPYKVGLQSERGRRSAAEWALWHAVRALRAHKLTSAK